MKLITRCLPIGSLAYNNIEPATMMMAKLFEQMPSLAFLPNIDPEDNINNRTFTGIPGIKAKENKLVLRISSNAYKQALVKLDKAYNNPTLENLAPYAIEAPYLDKFLKFIKKFKSAQACINLLGPFTIAQRLMLDAEEHTLADKNFRKHFIQSVCVKALWAIEKIKEISPKTQVIVILEEPFLGRLGTLKRENEEITEELITHLFTRVIDKLHSAGALVAIHSTEKCDWQVPINAGADIISFDAYNNPNNLSIIPEQVTEFISRGGKINWAIVPTTSETVVKGLNIEYLKRRLIATFEGLINAGVPAKLVYNSAIVSTQGDVAQLPIIFGEKAIMLAVELSKKIPKIE